MTDETELLKSEIKRLRKQIATLTPSLEMMLKLRGFIIYKKESADDLLKPDSKHADAFYQNLKKYSFRLFLRDVIKHQNSFTAQKVARYATEGVVSRYIEFLLKSDLAEKSGKVFRLKKRPVKSFGETLEWLVAELIKNDFQIETAWGVRFKRPKVGGDYDLIAKIDNSLLYMEVKSSPPKQIYDNQISSFFDRIEDLSPDIAIFFVDTELRMKDKIVPMFEDELQRRYNRPVKIRRIIKELFHINKKIFIINAKGGISSNVRRVFTFYWHKDFEID